MKAKFPITPNSCPMCGTEIDVLDETDTDNPGWICRYYTCRGCGHVGRIFFDFSYQQGLPPVHRTDKDWSYAERVEKMELSL